MVIAESGIIATGMYVIAWVMVLALSYDACRLGFVPNSLRWAAVLLVIHPGLWMGTLGGDCGLMARHSSVLVTCLIGGLLALHALLTFGGHPDLPAAPDPSDLDSSLPLPSKPQ